MHSKIEQYGTEEKRYHYFMEEMMKGGKSRKCRIESETPLSLREMLDRFQELFDLSDSYGNVIKVCEIDCDNHDQLYCDIKLKK